MIYKIKKFQEPIECMARVGGNNNSKFEFCVCVNPDSRRRGDPYIKYYNAITPSKATSVIRLGIKTFKKIEHKCRYDYWNITTKEAKVLDNFLSQKVGGSNYTYWEKACYLWNSEYGFILDIPSSYRSEIDAYIDGYYDTKENLSHPSYVPSNQPRIIYSDHI